MLFDMKKRIPIGLKLPPDLIEEVDNLRQAHDFPPDRTEIIERALRDWVRAETARQSAQKTS